MLSVHFLPLKPDESYPERLIRRLLKLIVECVYLNKKELRPSYSTEIKSVTSWSAGRTKEPVQYSQFSVLYSKT
jgi:hypothetical protein